MEVRRLIALCLCLVLLAARGIGVHAHQAVHPLDDASHATDAQQLGTQPDVDHDHRHDHAPVTWLLAAESAAEHLALHLSGDVVDSDTAADAGIKLVTLFAMAAAIVVWLLPAWTVVPPRWPFPPPNPRPRHIRHLIPHAHAPPTTR